MYNECNVEKYLSISPAWKTTIEIVAILKLV